MVSYIHIHLSTHLILHFTIRIRHSIIRTATIVFIDTTDSITTMILFTGIAGDTALRMHTAMCKVIIRVAVFTVEVTVLIIPVLYPYEMLHARPVPHVVHPIILEIIMITGQVMMTAGYILTEEALL